MRVDPVRQPVDLGAAIERGHGFVVDEQAAAVQVGRAAQRQHVIDHHRLGVQHGRQQAHVHPGFNQLAHRAAARPVGQAVVGSARQQQRDLQAALGGQHQRLLHRLVGHVVGGGQQQPLFGMEGGRDQQRVQHVFMKIRAARHPLRERGKRGVGRWCGGVIGGVAGLLQRLLPRKALGIAQPQRLPRAARDAPVAVEQRLRLRRQRALGGKAQVEPGRLADAADEVFIGQVAPARPHHLTIGDQQLAVVAQVDAPAPRPPQRRHEQARAHARVLQHGVVAVRAFQAADAVDQQANPHAGARAVGQRGGHGGAHFVIAQHVGAKVQRVARRADHALQLRQRRLAIRFKSHHRLRPRAGHAQRR